MKIGVVDYGASNIFSVVRALDFLGAKVKVVDLPNKIKDVDRLVFPGQGSMGACIQKLESMDMIEPLNIFIKNKPFLGICLGLQVLFDESEESNGAKGLGFFQGKINKISTANSSNLKVPHMGWNNVMYQKGHSLFDGIESDQFFYFVHSYVFDNLNSSNVIATTSYGNDFVSALAKENVFASQFHPEKSGKEGLKFLDNFIGWDI